MSDNSSDHHGSDVEFSEQANIEEEEPYEDEILNEENNSEAQATDSTLEIQQVTYLFIFLLFDVIGCYMFE
jgi:hypothetical protein